MTQPYHTQIYSLPLCPCTTYSSPTNTVSTQNKNVIYITQSKKDSFEYSLPLLLSEHYIMFARKISKIRSGHGTEARCSCTGKTRWT